MSDVVRQNWDDDYATSDQKMTPRVAIDNESCANATIIKVDGSANKNGKLLEVVQALTDLNLNITKVFSVVDRDGKKIRDQANIDKVESYMRQSLGAESSLVPPMQISVDVATSTDYTVIELTGNDRPGLLSELSAMLSDLNCNLTNVVLWTHNMRVAAVLHLMDQSTNTPITDAETIGLIKIRLKNILKWSSFSSKGVKIDMSVGCSKNIERRLHKLMYDEGYFEIDSQDVSGGDTMGPTIKIKNWNDKDYSVVTVRYNDRPKLLFDTVCALTDMMYVIFHGNIAIEGPKAYQEFYIRHVNGSKVKDEDREWVIHWLKEAIERRVSELEGLQGLRLELSTSDRVGLLSDVTRIFREHGLTVTRADVSSSREGKAFGTFYVRDSSGGVAEQKRIETIRKTLEESVLRVEGQVGQTSTSSKQSPVNFLFSKLFRTISFLPGF
ncbi:hypothetical protein LUZ61_009674 [Rhynchospora tenuis]|uniref:ACT domain-containing protein ACR n=1 Tax=Rhynchospora tenuis TaxID=198213 RepID=A0AAD6EYM3_9POAL|nr:hypothetical protein LUZ61_009674 [Rhynchospora tenuis]